ncbi:hypothetical protein ACFFX0_19820 [Citricoccus parietis]|uniref:Uncharacterized protein n=1 Tax=Citricoccus parietis TaxID=592307 RepID=A0ABV5G316_9MICC
MPNDPSAGAGSSAGVVNSSPNSSSGRPRTSSIRTPSTRISAFSTPAAAAAVRLSWARMRNDSHWLRVTTSPVSSTVTVSPSTRLEE